jgi:hypothetical protein
MQLRKQDNGYDPELSGRSIDELHRDVSQTKADIQSLLTRIAGRVTRGEDPRPSSVRGRRGGGIGPLTRRVLARYPSALIIAGLVLIAIWAHTLVWHRVPKLVNKNRKD